MRTAPRGTRWRTHRACRKICLSRSTPRTERQNKHKTSKKTISAAWLRFKNMKNVFKKALKNWQSRRNCSNCTVPALKCRSETRTNAQPRRQETTNNTKNNGGTCPKCSDHRQGQTLKDLQKTTFKDAAHRALKNASFAGLEIRGTKTRKRTEPDSGVIEQFQAIIRTTVLPVEATDGTSSWSQLAQNCQKPKRISKAAEWPAPRQPSNSSLHQLVQRIVMHRREERFSNGNDWDEMSLLLLSLDYRPSLANKHLKKMSYKRLSYSFSITKRLLLCSAQSDWSGCSDPARSDRSGCSGRAPAVRRLGHHRSRKCKQKAPLCLRQCQAAAKLQKKVKH